MNDDDVKETRSLRLLNSINYAPIWLVGGVVGEWWPSDYKICGELITKFCLFAGITHANNRPIQMWKVNIKGLYHTVDVGYEVTETMNKKQIWIIITKAMN